MRKQTSVDVTEFSPQLLNVALAMSLQWGENWLAPIQSRILQRYPSLSRAQADILNLWCLEVREHVFALVAEEYQLALQDEPTTDMQRAQRSHPQIDDENLARLYNQGMYYAWRG